MRGLGKSLVRAGKSNEAAAIWEKVVTTPGSDPEDKVMLADAQIRANEWARPRRRWPRCPLQPMRRLTALAGGAGRRQREELEKGRQFL